MIILVSGYIFRKRDSLCLPKSIRIPMVAKTEVIWFSPLFPNSGSLGTAGRVCSKTSKGTDGCEIMCCGRGYDTTRVTRVTQCECKFHWCCAVRCKECRNTVDVHTCKAPKKAEWLDQTWTHRYLLHPSTSSLQLKSTRSLHAHLPPPSILGCYSFCYGLGEWSRGTPMSWLVP